MNYSQECKTYTLHYDNVEEMEYFCSLDPLTGEVIKLNYLPDVQVIQHGFSGINPIRGQYYFYGLDANNNGILYSIDLVNGNIINAIDFPTTEINGNIIEMHYHPFKNLIYALHYNYDDEMEYLISFSATTGEISIIDSIPEVQLVQSDFSALNYLKNEYYFLGMDAENNYRLYTLDVNTGEILYNPIMPSENINGGLNELEVNILRGSLHSLHYDQIENMEYFTRINYVNGEVTKLAPIPDVQYIQAGFSAINSNDGEYYFNGITSNNEGYIYTIDIYSGEVLNQATVFGENFNGGLNELQFPNIEPAPIIMSQTSICSEDSALIIAPPEFSSYQWSNGSEGDHIYVRDSSEYSLILTKDYGCTDTILPMPLQVYNCEDYTDSIIQIHDSCFFEPADISMSYLSNIELDGNQVDLNWNFISLYSDTIVVPTSYEINENGLYEVLMGFNCNDKSNESLYSNMLQIDHLNITAVQKRENKGIFIYPNPAKDILNIDAGLMDIPLNLKIYSTSNQLLMNKNIHPQEQIQLDQFPKGMYLIVIENDQFTSTYKVVKE